MNKKSKLILVLAIGAVVILIASSVVRCTLVHQDNQFEQGDVAAASLPDDVNTEEDAEEPSLENHDVSGVLKKNAWVSEDNKATIVFKDGRYIESDGTNSTMATFDGSNIRYKTNQVEITTELDMPDGSTKASLILVRQDDSGAYTVSSDDFTLAKTYLQGEVNLSDVEVVAVNDEFRELLGGTTDALEQAITDYAHEHVPTASKATWNKTIVVDYMAGKVSANFVCNDAACTSLTVEYTRDINDFFIVG